MPNCDLLLELEDTLPVVYYLKLKYDTTNKVYFYLDTNIYTGIDVKYVIDNDRGEYNFRYNIKALLSKTTLNITYTDIITGVGNVLEIETKDFKDLDCFIAYLIYKADGSLGLQSRYYYALNYTL